METADTEHHEETASRGNIQPPEAIFVITNSPKIPQGAGEESEKSSSEARCPDLLSTPGKQETDSSEQTGTLQQVTDMSGSEVESEDDSDIEVQHFYAERMGGSTMTHSQSLVHSAQVSSSGTSLDTHKRTSASSLEVETKRTHTSEEHNRKERIRRKDMKDAVLELRNQLRRPTKKPSTRSVLEAAQQEIRELTAIKDSDERRLEELKKKHSHLQWKLEKLVTEVDEIPCHRIAFPQTENSLSQLPLATAPRPPPFPIVPSIPFSAPPPPPAVPLVQHGLSNHLVAPSPLPLPLSFINFTNLPPLTNFPPPPSLTPPVFSVYPGSAQIPPNPLLSPHLTSLPLRPVGLSSISTLPIGPMGSHGLSPTSSPNMQRVLRPESYILSPPFPISIDPPRPSPIGLSRFVGGSSVPPFLMARPPRPPLLYTSVRPMTEHLTSKNQPVFPVTLFNQPPPTSTNSHAVSSCPLTFVPSSSSVTTLAHSNTPDNSNRPTNTMSTLSSVNPDIITHQDSVRMFSAGKKTNIHSRTPLSYSNSKHLQVEPQGNMDVLDTDAEESSNEVTVAVEKEAGESVVDGRERWTKRDHRRSSSDSDSGGSCLSGPTGHSRQKSRRSVIPPTTSCSSSSTKSKSCGNKSKKCTNNKFDKSCIPPLIKVIDVMEDSGKSECEGFVVNLTSNCHISGEFESRLNHRVLPPCPALLGDQQEDSNSKMFEASQGIKNGAVNNWNDIVKRSVNNFEEKLSELSSDYLDGKRPHQITQNTMCPVIL